MHFERLLSTIEAGTKLYHDAMNDGVAPELARLFLPAYGMYVRWRWTVSLQGVMTFLDQRLEHDAQWEIQKYAQAVRDLSNQAFPETFKVVNDGK
jgi:thymidylate synthase (FAD)